MAFPYKCILLIGATSGIGLAFAERLVAEGSKVIAVGRRKDRLDAFVQKHGSIKAAAVPYDITDVASLPKFVNTVTRAYPELDCVFLNAGVQNKYDLSKPEELNLQGFHAEMAVNFSRFVDLTHAFLPFLSAKETPTSIIFTNSNLALVPAIGISAYCASKAALNTFVMCLREELRGVNSSVKIIEIWPPPVQSELHDRHMPDGRQFGMPANEFVDQAYAGLAEGKDFVQIGGMGPDKTFEDVIAKRIGLFDALSSMMRHQ